MGKNQAPPARRRNPNGEDQLQLGASFAAAHLGRTIEARALSAEAVEKIAGAMVEKADAMEARADLVKINMDRYGKTTGEHYRLVTEWKYLLGYTAALRNVYQNFKDNKKTRSGMVFV